MARRWSRYSNVDGVDMTMDHARLRTRSAFNVRSPKVLDGRVINQSIVIVGLSDRNGADDSFNRRELVYG
jgi:hypothetical protein